MVTSGTEGVPRQSGLTQLLKRRSLKAHRWKYLSVGHLREVPAAAGKGCALRCYRRSSADTISCAATCWISPTPTWLFTQDADKRFPTAMRFPQPWKEPSKAGCRALRSPGRGSAPGPPPTLPRWGNTRVRRLRSGGLLLPRWAPPWTRPSSSVRHCRGRGTWASDTLSAAGWADAGRQRVHPFRLFLSFFLPFFFSKDWLCTFFCYYFLCLLQLMTAQAQ